MDTTLDDLIDGARLLSEARLQLGTLVQALQAGIEALKADAMPEIRDAIADASEAWQELEKSIQANPELFVKPRTVAAHGIVFGLERARARSSLQTQRRPAR